MDSTANHGYPYHIWTLGLSVSRLEYQRTWIPKSHNGTPTKKPPKLSAQEIGSNFRVATRCHICGYKLLAEGVSAELLMQVKSSVRISYARTLIEIEPKTTQ